MRRRLPVAFFRREAPDVAPELLNKLLVVGECSGRIVEVEAYTSDDPASHAFRGPTPRNQAMFGPAGRFYVYVSYGIHRCANLVTGESGDGQGVLLRAVIPVDGIDVMQLRRDGECGHASTRRGLADGPGKLTQAFGITLDLNGVRADVYDDGVPPPEHPVVGPRIGISRAVDWPRRFRVPNERQ